MRFRQIVLIAFISVTFSLLGFITYNRRRNELLNFNTFY